MSMISPSITQLTKGKFNRYTLCLATAKCARQITDEYVKQREIAERRIANKETDKSLSSMISREYRDEKAVKVAINKLYNRDFVMVGLTDTDGADENAAENADESENRE